MSEIRHPNENPESVSPSQEAKKPEAVKPQEDDKKKLESSNEQKPNVEPQNEAVTSGSGKKHKPSGNDVQENGKLSPEGNDLPSGESFIEPTPERNKLSADLNADSKAAGTCPEDPRDKLANKESNYAENTPHPIESPGTKLDAQSDDHALKRGISNSNPDGLVDDDKAAKLQNKEAENGINSTSEKQPSSDVEPIKDTDDPNYKNRIDRTPVNNGHWENADGEPGVRGESKFVPDNPDVQKTLNENGVDGIEYRDGYPDFSPVSKFNTKLEPEDYQKSDRDQFASCNQNLQEAIFSDIGTGEIKDPELASHFSSDQLDDIRFGETPDGYTWHHDVEDGHMQLVPTDVHQTCRHSGGRALWGGGSDYR